MNLDAKEKNSIMVLSDEIFPCIFKNLPFKDLLNCTETCFRFEQIVINCLHFDSNLANKIFEPGNHIFKIKCFSEDLKIQFTANAFFQSHCFEEFVINRCLKVFNLIVPMPPRKEGHGFFLERLFPDRFTKTVEERSWESKEVLINFSWNFFLPKDLGFIFEEKIFCFLEQYNFSSLLANKVVKDYLETRNPIIFDRFGMILVGLYQYHLCHLGSTIPLYSRPLLETAYKILFKGFETNVISCICEEVSKDYPDEIIVVKNKFENFDPSPKIYAAIYEMRCLITLGMVLSLDDNDPLALRNLLNGCLKKIVQSLEKLYEEQIGK